MTISRSTFLITCLIIIIVFSSITFVSSLTREVGLENGDLDQISLSSPQPYRHPSLSRIPPTIPSSSQDVDTSLSSQTRLSSSRKSKFFPYFLIQFPKEPCTGSDGSTGMCMSAKECRISGGTTVSSCAGGFGACCKYVRTCGQGDRRDVEVKTMFAEIRAGNDSNSCRFVSPKGRGVCQVKLDFVAFAFGTGLPNGECSPTRVTIRNAANFGDKGIHLCGNLTGQHLYLHYGMASKIYIETQDALSGKDKVLIRMSQIRCDSRELVPKYCTQYYSGKEGQIRSFNWPQQQLNNQDYIICVEDSHGNPATNHKQVSQKIEWSTCGVEKSNFFIVGNSTTNTSAPADCSTDYIQIFGGNRQCNYPFKPETIKSPPYLLRVRFDERESGEVFQNSVEEEDKQEVVVSEPEDGCESLNTPETRCLSAEEEVNGTSLCCCRRKHFVESNDLLQLQQKDKGNTGFCFKYKLIE